MNQKYVVKHNNIYISVIHLDTILFRVFSGLGKCNFLIIYLADKRKIQKFGGFSSEKSRFHRVFLNIEKSIMKLKTICLLCFSCSIFYSMEGQNAQKGKETQPVTTLQMQLINEQIAELMADRVVLNKGLAAEELATIDDFFYKELLEYESLMFPADELYGSSWDTTWVNPFRSKEIAYPDSFSIDCTSFILPIDVQIKVTSLFGPRRLRMHNGIDLKVQTGDTIRSAFSGKVRLKGYERRGYGYYLVLRHPNGLETLYAHLSGFLVSENEIVQAGQAIGLGGNTGRSTGSHLHFETRFLGQALNPSHIIDFTDGTPHNDHYVLYKGNFGKNTNIYTSTSERIVYHRVQKGETLSKIALQYKTTVAELCRLNGLTSKSTLRIGQSIRCGTTFVKNTDATVAETPPEATGQIAAAYHTVLARETLSSIASKYGTTVDALCRLNNIQSTTPLRVGQEICYRAASKPVAPKNESQEEEEDNTGENSQIIASASDNTNTEETEIPVENSPVYYRIKEGDTLGAIAQKHGITINRLCELNNITRTTILRIGRSLRCS